MNARVVSAIARERDRRRSGDQLYVDLDLSTANLPPDTRLAIGSAVIAVTEEPHTACARLTSRAG